MKYPPALLTPFLAALPQKAPISFHCSSLISHQGTPLSAHTSIACSLLNSLAALFATPVLCFQSFADSFAKTGGYGGTLRLSPCSFIPSALREGQLHFCPAFVFKNLQIPLRACPPTPLFIFSHLRIPWRANPFVSHPYKTAGCAVLGRISGAPGCHPLKGFSVLSVPSVVSVLNSFLRPLPITI
jgi:hypothetical protein